MIPNILGERYAGSAMRNIWSPRQKVILERRLWIAILRAQQELGVDIPERAIRAYESKVTEVDLKRITERERITKHDVKARIDEFSALAGFQHIHKGLTSRDLTENIEQLQIRKSMILVRKRMVAVLTLLALNASRYAETLVTGRTHNVPAQATSLGKRFANAGEEMLQAFARLDELIARYPLRGIKGPVGTQQDQLDLLGGADAVHKLEEAVAEHLGFETVLRNVGQVYPRSLDFEVVSALVQAASGPANLARTIRLMAGHDLVTEGFVAGQVGSSAMPHKMNARSSERINGLAVVLRGYLEMTSALVGDQWNEGDVSCSVVRRVALPDAFFALDGLFETFLTVLEGFGAFEKVIEHELARYLPFLATTRVLLALVKAGVGREEAHDIVKENTVAAALDIRNGVTGNVVLKRFRDDPRVPLEVRQIRRLLKPTGTVGLVDEQLDDFAQRVEKIAVQYPKAAAYRPKGIL